MSATAGKVQIIGVADIGDEKAMVLRFLQGRNPDWVQKPFLAKYDEKAIWIDDFKPALRKNSFLKKN